MLLGSGALTVDMASSVGMSVAGGPSTVGPLVGDGPSTVGSLMVGGPSTVGPSEVGGPPTVGPSEVGGPPTVGTSEVGGPSTVGPSVVVGPPTVCTSEVGGPPTVGPSVVSGPSTVGPSVVSGPSLVGQRSGSGKWTVSLSADGWTSAEVVATLVSLLAGSGAPSVGVLLTLNEFEMRREGPSCDLSIPFTSKGNIPDRRKPLTAVSKVAHRSQADLKTDGKSFLVNAIPTFSICHAFTAATHDDFNGA